MPALIPINLVVEDALSEAVLRRVLSISRRHFEVGYCYGMRGFGYIKKNLAGFNQASRGTPFLVLTDLDDGECAAALLAGWLQEKKSPNLLFRVAVREVEAWLLADPTGLARYLGIREDLFPSQPDSVQDPKKTLIGLAARSRNRELRDAIVPRSGSTAITGPDYNGRLIAFVNSRWDARAAAERSDSLKRLLNAALQFHPCWD
jgi:hypothetical protein